MTPARAPAPESAFKLVEQRHDSPLGRWTLVLAIPTGPLAHLLEAVWTSRGEGVFSHEEILPRTPTEVLFALSAAVTALRASPRAVRCARTRSS